MDHNSLIDKVTYDVYKHAEDCPLMFICDKSISDSVALLNKKGYKTKASCGGHYKVEFYECFNCDISNYDEYSKNDRIIIKNVRNDSFDYLKEVDKTHIYILFDKKYLFDSLPDGFTYIDGDNTCIDSSIDFYDKNNNKRIRKDVECELEEKSKILYRWVDKLPIKRKGD